MSVSVEASTEANGASVGGAEQGTEACTDGRRGAFVGKDDVVRVDVDGCGDVDGDQIKTASDGSKTTLNWSRGYLARYEIHEVRQIPGI
jgi:hypothetical protein